MQLRLTVVRDPRRLLGERTVHAFSEAGGTIGRNSGCTLVLADGGNVISSRHAEIVFNGRGFVITDTSTNGVYLNRTDAPLGRGNSAILTGGDLLYLGDLVFKTEIGEEARDSRARLGLGGDGWTQARNARAAPPPPAASLEDVAGFKPATSADPLAGFAPSRPNAPSGKPTAQTRDPLAALNTPAESDQDLAGDLGSPSSLTSLPLVGGAGQRPSAAGLRQIPASLTLSDPVPGFPAVQAPPQVRAPNPMAVAPPVASAPQSPGPIPDLSELMGGPRVNVPPASVIPPAPLPPLPAAVLPPAAVPPLPVAPIPPLDADFLSAPPAPFNAPPVFPPQPAFPPPQAFAPPPPVSQPASPPASQAPIIPDDFTHHLMGIPGFAPPPAPPAPAPVIPQNAAAPNAVVPNGLAPNSAAPHVAAPYGAPPLPGQRAPLRPELAASFVNLRRRDETPGAPLAGPSLDPVAMLRKRAEGRPDATRIGQTRVPPAAPMRQPVPDAAPPNAPMDDALAGFWQALGIDPTQIDPARRAAMLQILAATIRESVTGLIEVLSARSAIKDEFRMDQTQIQPQENNPLKFFRSGEEALRRTLLASQPGFLSLDIATRKGFEDIKAHEVAAMTAMQKAIPALFQRMSPTAIEQAAAPASFGRKPDKAKLWDQFVELYNRFADTLEFAIPETITTEFARAYREQIDQMTNGGQS